ncbi:MAG: DUF190 domain-containing protein [Candidatus Aenigmarchaeota archaeon]|nr:DUF190 domain-containing protein [Candidatus Aenigmarchaeota archaeon]
MKKESEAVLLRIFIGESDMHEGKPLYKHLLELFRKEGISGATVLRGIGGYGKTSHLRTTSILRLSSDLPVAIEIVDTRENIERIKPLLDGKVNGGLITEETVKIIYYEGKTGK